MAIKGLYPRSGPAFNNYVVLAVAYLNNHSARLKVSAAHLSELNNLYSQSAGSQSEWGWHELWKVYVDKTTVTTATRSIINSRRKQLEKHLRLIYGNIPKSVLNEMDRNTLNLKLRNTQYSTVQVVNYSPELSFAEIKPGMHTIRIQNPETPHQKAMPYKHAIDLQYFVAENKVDNPEHHFSKNTHTHGKHLVKIQYQPNQKGKTAFYRARYRTHTGKAATWSNIINQLIL